MKLELMADYRRTLRAEAHHLQPVVMIGNDGLTSAVLHEIDLNLLSHGLIKIRVFSDDREAREAMMEQIASELEASPVQHIGKLLVLYRPLPKEEKAEPAGPKKRPVRGRAAPVKKGGGKAVAKPPRADRRPRTTTGTGTGTRTAKVRTAQGRRRRTTG